MYLSRRMQLYLLLNLNYLLIDITLSTILWANVLSHFGNGERHSNGWVCASYLGILSCLAHLFHVVSAQLVAAASSLCCCFLVLILLDFIRCWHHLTIFEVLCLILRVILPSLLGDCFVWRSTLTERVSCTTHDLFTNLLCNPTSMDVISWLPLSHITWVYGNASLLGSSLFLNGGVIVLGTPSWVILIISVIRILFSEYDDFLRILRECHCFNRWSSLFLLDGIVVGGPGVSPSSIESTWIIIFFPLVLLCYYWLIRIFLCVLCLIIRVSIDKI